METTLTEYRVRIVPSEPTDRDASEPAPFLLSHAAICRAGDIAEADGGTAIGFAIEQFRSILRHFLRFTPFCEQSYLEANPDRTDVVVAQAHSVLRYRTAAMASLRCSPKCSKPSTIFSPIRRRSVSAVLRHAART